MTDPAAMEGMMGMMKGNMAMMIPQTLIMSWINAFFAGFVISESFGFEIGNMREALKTSLGRDWVLMRVSDPNSETSISIDFTI